jgi:glucose-6-phosphate isomerase
MKAVFWVVIIAALAGLAWLLARWRRQWKERQQAAEARMASFIAQAAPSTATVAVAAPVAPPPIAPQERLLLDAASKAGEAGEPALSIQLYAKLLARYPQTSFAAHARAAIEAQKKKLAQA